MGMNEPNIMIIHTNIYLSLSPSSSPGWASVLASIVAIVSALVLGTVGVSIPNIVIIRSTFSL